MLYPLSRSKIFDTSTSFLQRAWDAALHYLTIALQWTGQQCLRALSTIYKVLKIEDIFNYAKLMFWQILKWCFIVAAVWIGIIVTITLGPWTIRKLRDICMAIIDEVKEIRRYQEQERRLRQQQEEEAERQAAAAEAILQRTRARRLQLLREQEQQRRDQERQQRERQDRIDAEIRKAARKRAAYQEWERTCETVLRDKPAMTWFPLPRLDQCPGGECEGCINTGICWKSLMRLLEGSNALTPQVLKKHREYWHPDRFLRCKDDCKEEFIRQGQNLFVAFGQINAYLEKKKKAEEEAKAWARARNR